MEAGVVVDIKMDDEVIFKTKGDRDRKEEARLKYQKNIEIFKEYEKKCNDWKKVHFFYLKIIEEDTTLEEAISYFIDICKTLITAMDTKKIPFSKGGFVEKLFDDFPFHYTDKVYDMFDGELYGIAELFGCLKDEEDFANLKKEFETFLKKYGSLLSR